MKLNVLLPLLVIALIINFSCTESTQVSKDKTAADILGNSDYIAISYGGYRHGSRDTVPTLAEMKEDLKIMSAMGIRLLRTYNTQQYPHAANLLKAIREMKEEDPTFEMYVMLGAWIDCEDAWTKVPNHDVESLANNTAEIEAAIKMANTYSDIVKVIAVGNESMVHWAVTYFVKPDVILKWVNHLQHLKQNGKLPADLWITSSDNYESWGGGSAAYHNDQLAALVKAVDYVSLHTYPFHDTHYNPNFWHVPIEEDSLTKVEQIDAAMLRAKDYAQKQYKGVSDYLESLDVEKPIHIGETGWSSIANVHYGEEGSHAADEYKQKIYFDHMREWTNTAGISCFYFEAFDEPWKDDMNPLGSENHFGLINIKGEAKFALWDVVDNDVFDGLTRGGRQITKTYGGKKNELMKDVLVPQLISQMDVIEIATVNENREFGTPVTEGTYVILNDNFSLSENTNATYPTKKLKLNGWEGTSYMRLLKSGVVEVTSGLGEWWGAGIEIQGNGKGENLTEFANGIIHFEMRCDTKSNFEVGFQTGHFANGTQTNNFADFGPQKKYATSKDWKSYTLKIAELSKEAKLDDVTGLFIFREIDKMDGKKIYLRNIYYSK